MDCGPDSGKKSSGLNLLHQQIDAYAFNAEWGPEMVGGTIILSATELRFDYSDGHLVIPIGRLRAEVRPGDEERIAFTDLEKPGLEIFSSEMELLDCQALPPLAQAREEYVQRLSGRELKRRVRILAYCVGVCIVLTILGSIILGAMVRSIAGRVPPEWDANFGTLMIEELGSETNSLSESNILAQVEALAAPLLEVVPRTTNGYTFHLVVDDEPNAAALPGGHIIIHTGLLDLADQPEEIVGVLAHEVAHVTERHLYRKVISSAGPMVICQAFLGGRSGGFGTLMGASAALMIGAGFSQEYETEADNVGWEYLVKANIDPRGMIRMFEKFKAYDGGDGWDGTQAFSSHPALAKRIKRLEARWAKLRQKSDFIQLPAIPKPPPTAKPSVKRLLPPEEEGE